MILDFSPIFIRTTSTASFFMRTCKNWEPTDNAGLFFSLKNSIARLTTENVSSVFLNFNRSPIDGSATNNALGIWISDIMLSHSTSIPQI